MHINSLDEKKPKWFYYSLIKILSECFYSGSFYFKGGGLQSNLGYWDTLFSEIARYKVVIWTVTTVSESIAIVFLFFFHQGSRLKIQFSVKHGTKCNCRFVTRGQNKQIKKNKQTNKPRFSRMRERRRLARRCQSRPKLSVAVLPLLKLGMFRNVIECVILIDSSLVWAQFENVGLGRGRKRVRATTNIGQMDADWKYFFRCAKQ